MMSKIKICFILSHLPQGGAERQTINLIKGLNPLEYDITLLIYSSIEVFYQEVYALPIHLVINNYSNNNKFIRSFKNLHFLRRYLTQNDFEIIHTLLFHNGFWVRLLLPKRYNNRIVYSIRNSLNDSSKLFLFFEKLFINKTIATTNSLKSKNQFEKLVGAKYKERISTIYNGIDTDRFAAHQLPMLSDKITIGTVGRQTAQKNQIQIFQVIKEIKDEIPLLFYLIGDKSLDKSFEIEKYIRDNSLESFVTIMDSQINIEKYYKRFNIFVLSSIYEGCPNALLEAMLSKCLCIISEGANSDQFIKDGVNGFVYDGSNDMLKSKIKQAIQLLYNMKADEIVNNGYQYVLENFSITQMITGYELIYRQILK